MKTTILFVALLSACGGVAAPTAVPPTVDAGEPMVDAGTPPTVDAGNIPSAHAGCFWQFDETGSDVIGGQTVQNGTAINPACEVLGVSDISSQEGIDQYSSTLSISWEGTPPSSLTIAFAGSPITCDVTVNAYDPTPGGAFDFSLKNCSPWSEQLADRTATLQVTGGKVAGTY